MKRFFSFLVLILCLNSNVYSQQAQTAPTIVQLSSPYVLQVLTATTAINNQTTLTIPAAPSGQFTYICTLDFNASNNATGTANTNSIITSTNFTVNAISWAWKYSLALAANTDYDKQFNWTSPWGCAKTTAQATATTFVSPAALASTAFTFSTSFYYAP